MSLENYTSTTSEADLSGVRIGPIRDIIDEKYWSKFTQYDEEGKTAKLDRDHYIITYLEPGSIYPREEFFVVPYNRRGFLKSGIKEIMLRNNFGPNPLEWTGKIIMEFDKKGYAKLAR